MHILIVKIHPVNATASDPPTAFPKQMYPVTYRVWNYLPVHIALPFTLVWSALDERITRIPLWTAAHGNVVDYLASGVLSASAGTWVHALLPNTGLVPRTIGAQNALRPTTHVRVSLILGRA